MNEVVYSLSPLLCLVAGTVSLLTFDIFGLKKLANLSAVLFVFLGFYCGVEQLIDPVLLTQDLLVVDSFSSLFSLILLGGMALSLMLSIGVLKHQGVQDTNDVRVISMLAACGGMLMIYSSHLILFFVAFELMSISVYAMSGLARKEKASSESSLKYFVLGSFSSAFLLYGISMIYGFAGSLELHVIALASQTPSLLLYVGVFLVLLGFAFKIALVPFHIWTPDVYQGSPSSVTTFMAVVVKIAAVGAMLRVVSTAFWDISAEWVGLIWVLSMFSMLVGNLGALAQTSFKRMLAYSSIAHAGYMMLGLLALQDEGAEALTYYLIIYSVMTVASFGLAMMISAGTERQYAKDSYDSLKGLGWSHPLQGLLITVTMLSLAGMPPLAGFVGKFYLFKSALAAGYTGLVIIAAVNSVLSLYYYLRVIVYMYFGNREDTPEVNESVMTQPFSLLAVSISALVMVIFGIAGETLMNIVRAAVAGS